MKRWFDVTVPESWLDQNGHMNEAHYLECFSRASDGWFAAVGIDEAYIASGKSYFTVETHIRHLGGARAGAALYVEARLLQRRGKTMRAFQWLRRATDDALLATGEHLFVHVDLTSRRACEPGAEIAARIDAMVTAAASDWPEGAGAAIGSR